MLGIWGKQDGRSVIIFAIADFSCFRVDIFIAVVCVVTTGIGGFASLFERDVRIG